MEESEAQDEVDEMQLDSERLRSLQDRLNAMNEEGDAYDNEPNREQYN